MEIKITLNDLTKEDILTAIEHEEKDALTKLIIEKYHETKDKGAQVKNFYYAPYIECSSEEFDMFTCGGLISLFNIYGYKTELTLTHKDEYDINYGKLIVKRDGFCFTMDTMEGMHGSLYADFVDAKTATIQHI